MSASSVPPSQYPSVILSEREYSRLKAAGDVAAAAGPRELIHRAVAMRGGRKSDFLNKKPFRTKLWSNVSNNSSGANSALQYSQPTAYNSAAFPDFTNILALFDEMRVIKGVMHFHFSTSTAGTAYYIASAAVGFDPTLGTPTTDTQNFIQTYHSPPIFVSGTTVQTIPTSLPYMRIPFRMPGPLAPVTSSDIPGSAWFAIDGSTAPDLVQVMAHAGSAGTGGVSTFSYFIELDVELKIRT
jgi:hypothetical protein